MNTDRFPAGTAALAMALLFATLSRGPVSAQEAVDAEALYVNNCGACHGYFGEGDGPVAAALRVTVPNLRTLSMRNAGIFPREAVTAYVDGRDIPTAHGSRTMPIWGDVFEWAEDEQQDAEALGQRRIEAIITFVETLQYQ
jgi:mono/diheme cytochrome c family protein